MKEQVKQYCSEVKVNQQVEKKINEILSDTKRYNFEEAKPVPFNLKKLEVENFPKIGEAVVDFSKKVVEIGGENASGKTLLTEIITLMLINYGRDTMKSFLSKDTRLRMFLDIDNKANEILINKEWIRSEGTTIKNSGQTEVLKFLKSKGMDEVFKDVITITDIKSYITEKDPRLFKEFFMQFFNIDSSIKIKEDISKSLNVTTSDIGRLKTECNTLMDGDGPNTIAVQINMLEKKLKESEKVKKEYVDIVAKSGNGIVKVHNEIEKIEKKLAEKKALSKKVETVVENQNVFKELDKKKKELTDKQKEMSKIVSEREKIDDKIKGIRVEIESKEDGIKQLVRVESKCPVCESDIPVVRKQLILKDKEDSIKGLQDSINKLGEKLTELTVNEDEVDQLNKVANNLMDCIVIKLNPINIKTQKNIEQIMEKYNIDDVKREVLEIENDLLKKNSKLDKLSEEKPKKRMKELESQMEEIKKVEIELGVWQEKKANYEERAERIGELKKQLKIKEFDLGVLKSACDIFDKGLQSSFPIWYLNSSIKQIEEDVNVELKNFKNLTMHFMINSEFKISINNRSKKALSTAELKILNFIMKVVVARRRFEVIPFIIFDDYKSGFEVNTLKILKGVINYYIENGIINNVILTNPTEDAKLKIVNSDKIL